MLSFRPMGEISCARNRLAGSPKAIRPGARQTTAAAPAVREAGRAPGGIITEPMGGGAGEGLRGVMEVKLALRKLIKVSGGVVS